MSSSLHNIWLIAKREYTERVRTKAFIISTVLIPTLMGGGVFGVSAIASHSKTTSHIAIVASQPQPALDLKQALEHGEDTSMTVDLVPQSNAASLDRAIASKQLDGYLVIQQDSG